MPPPGFLIRLPTTRSHLTGFLLLGKLAIAVIHEDDDIGVGGAGGICHLLDGIQVKCIALQIAAAALDMADLGPGSLLRDEVIVRGKIGLEGSFVVLDAVIHQGTGTFALAVQTNNAFQRVIGTAGSGQQGITGPQQAEEGHCQRMGTALELAAHQRILCTHHLGEDLLQFGAAGIPQAIACGAQHIGRGHLSIRESFQHLELVIVADLLHLLEVGLAELEGLFIQCQNLGFIIEKVV